MCFSRVRNKVVWGRGFTKSLQMHINWLRLSLASLYLDNPQHCTACANGSLNGNKADNQFHLGTLPSRQSQMHLAKLIIHIAMYFEWQY